MKKIIALTIAAGLLISGIGIAEGLNDIFPADFIFASGAGAWRTEMTIEKDMSFHGEYSDSEMAESGEGYQYGSCYLCDFKGNFTMPEAAEDGTYSTMVAALEFEKQPGEEYIEDEIRYVAEEAYGISEGDRFIIYPKGFPTADMEEGAVEWCALVCAWGTDVPEKVSETVFYNSTQEYSFVKVSFE